MRVIVNKLISHSSSALAETTNTISAPSFYGEYLSKVALLLVLRSLAKLEAAIKFTNEASFQDWETLARKTLTHGSKRKLDKRGQRIDLTQARVGERFVATIVDECRVKRFILEKGNNSQLLVHEVKDGRRYGGGDEPFPRHEYVGSIPIGVLGYDYITIGENMPTIIGYGSSGKIWSIYVSK